MIDDIIKNIDFGKEAQIEQLRKSQQQKIEELKKRAKERLARTEAEAVLALEKENENKIAEFLENQQRKADFKREEAKNKIVDEVWSGVYDRIIESPDDFILRLVRFVPKDLSGEIKCSARALPIVKSKIKNMKVEGGLKEEGFLVRTKTLDLDFRISEVLAEVREEHNPEIIKILFNHA